MNPTGGGEGTSVPGHPDRTNDTADRVKRSGRPPERLAVLDPAVRAAVDDVLLTVHDGGSRALVVSGAPGTGRSTVLAAAEDTAQRLGLTVAHARALPNEWSIGLSVASRLFDALPGQAPAGWRPDHWHEPPGLDRLARLGSALAAAARRNPLALLVDDVCWADPASDALLRMVLRRLRHAPLALVVTTSGAWPSVPAGVQDNDDVPPSDDVLRLGPLTGDQVREACRRICGRASDEQFTAGALTASGGNPRVLAGALTDYSHIGHPVGAPGRSFLDLVAEHRRRQVVGVLDSLPRTSVEVLRVLAVADGDLDYGQLRALAGGGDRPVDVLADLRACGLVARSGPVRPADPVVRERVLAGMPVPARRSLHAAVAALAHRGAASDAVVSRILLGTHRPPGAWSVGALRRAAATALDAGRAEDAVALVECALNSHLAVDQRADLLLDLACALVADRPEAADRALALVVAAPGDDPATRTRGLRAVDLLLTRGAAAKARRVITTRLAVLDGDDSTEAATERTALAALHTLARGIGHQPAAETPLPVPATAGGATDPVSAGVTACLLAARGTDRARAIALAATALMPTYDEQPLGLPRLAAATALLLADEFDAAGIALNTLLGDARRRRARATAACTRLGFAARAVYCGRLDDADEHLTEIYAELPRASWHPLIRPVVAANRVVVEVCRGALDTAERILADECGGVRPADGAVQDAERGFAHAFLLYARGAFALAAGDPGTAERDLRECGRRLAARRWHNPLLVPWRALLARAMHANGGQETQIRDLVTGGRRLAAEWGAPSAVGSADLAAGIVLGALGDPAAPGLLADAERVLRTTPLRLRHAEALAALGRSLVEDDVAESAEAGGDLLSEAVGIAGEAGATPLRERVERDLRAAADPAGRRTVTPGADAVLAKLSAAESRVVEYAVAGLSNPEIADALSVTRRMVELHLSRAYRKLGVSRRAELPGLALAGPRG